MLLNQEGVIIPSTEGMKLFSYFYIFFVYMVYNMQSKLRVRQEVVIPCLNVVHMHVNISSRFT